MGQRGGKRDGAGAPRGPRRITVAREIVGEVVYEEMQKRNANQKRGIDTLDEQMRLWMGVAAKIQRDYPETFSTDKTFRYAMERAGHAAAELAKYQTPRFKAIPVREVPPLPKQPAGEAPAATPAKGSNVISAVKKRSAQANSDVYARMVRGG